jgi:hypothetical protein
MKDGNNRSLLGVDNSSGSNNWNVWNLMVINALDINGSHGVVDDANIISSNTTIGALINKGTLSSTSVGRH